MGGGEKLGCLKLYSERCEGGIVRTQAAKTETWIFRKIVELQNSYFLDKLNTYFVF